MFLNREQVEIVEGKIREKAILKHNLSLARERAEDEIQQRQKLLYKNGPPKMQHEVTFKEEDHTKVKNIKPFVKQIVSDMKSHACDINPATVGFMQQK